MILIIFCFLCVTASTSCYKFNHRRKFGQIASSGPTRTTSVCVCVCVFVNNQTVMQETYEQGALQTNHLG